MIEPGKKVVLFPIETVVRELDFRLMLAAYCARSDTQIVIGKQRLLELLLFRLHGGLFVGKNLATWKSNQPYRTYKARGFRTVFLHEEGAFYQGRPEDWAKRLHEILDVEQIEPGDHVCTWGEFQADCYRARQPRCLDHIVVTGHPRFSLLSPKHRLLYEAEAGALRKRFGPFVLLNTNFGWNNAKGMDFSFCWYRVKPEDRQRRTYYLDQFCVSAIKWARFLQLINTLSDHFPELQFVVRPHPAESIHSYVVLRHVPRVTVIREGALGAWLLASEAVIHDGCTTALEACLAGCPVINFRPVPDERFDVVLPNLAGVSCTTEAEVEQTLRRFLKSKGTEASVTPENAGRITRLLANFDSGVDSFERMARIIHQVLDEISPTRVTGLGPVLGRHRLKDAVWHLLRPLDPVSWLGRLGKRDRGYQKFPPLERRDIREKISTIRKITGRPIEIRFHGHHLLSMFLHG